MPTPKLSESQASEARKLIAQYGSPRAASEATGIPRQTLHRRAKSGALPTRVELARPETPKLAKLQKVVSQRKHLIVPDTQCQPAVPLDHMTWAGRYACVKRPEVIVFLGDHWNMGSLSSYERGKGKKSFEGQRYRLDIEAGNLALDLFMEPIYDEVERSLSTDAPWQPKLHFIMGNHEERILRAVNDAPESEGTIGYHNFNLDKHGFEVHQFLDVAVIDGIAYSHYFTSGVMGRSVTTASALLRKKHMSAVMGHIQIYQTAMENDAAGKRLTALLAGCYYQHDERYLDVQTNAATWRGIHVLYGVTGDGEFTHNSIDLAYLKDRFDGR